MPMNLEAVGAVSEPGRTSWTSKDALLYALGIGAGQTDPTGFELEFTTENSMNIEQRVFPTMPVIISMGGGPGLPSWGEFDFRMLLHGEQGVTVHGPIPPDGEVDTVSRIVGIYDKGKAAVIRLENTATYVGSGKPTFTTRFAAFIRGEGGFGESRGDEIADPPKAPEPRPTEKWRTRRAATRPCCTGSPVTATRCTRIRRSRSSPASSVRSSTASARTASPAGRCSTACAAPTSPSSRAWTRASPSR